MEQIEEHARLRPHAPALLFRGKPFSYSDLARETACVRQLLEQAGGDGPLGMPGVKHSASIAWVLACLQLRRPILLTSPDLGSLALDDVMQRAGCSHIVRSRDGETTLRELAHEHRHLADTALLLTTSGSTGLPKLVPLGPKALDQFTLWAADHFHLGPGIRVFNYAPLNFDLCLLDIWATLRAGGCAVLVEAENAVSPRHLVELTRTTEPHVVQAVPLLFQLLAGAATDCAAAPSVRHVILTGDHTPLKTRNHLPRLFPDATFYNVYGCTETNDSFMHSFGADEAKSRETLPLGEPLPGVRATLVEDELLVSTPFQTRGYLDGPNDRFVERDGDTFFRTGDLVRKDEHGALTLAGRNDFQVKVRGVRVNLEEIERVLLDHPDVSEAAVVALPDATTGTRLCAVVFLSNERTSALRLRDHCASRLTRAAIPSHIELARAPLPRTITGKIDRSQIRSAHGSRQ